MGTLSAPPWPLEPKGEAVFVIMPGKEKRPFVEQLEENPVPKSPSSSSCQCSLQWGAQGTACQLFSRLRKSGFLSPWLGRGTWIDLFLWLHHKLFALILQHKPHPFICSTSLMPVWCSDPYSVPPLLFPAWWDRYISLPLLSTGFQVGSVSWRFVNDWLLGEASVFLPPLSVSGEGGGSHSSSCMFSMVTLIGQFLPFSIVSWLKMSVIFLHIFQ